jgi:hypothetical protein
MEDGSVVQIFFELAVMLKKGIPTVNRHPAS